MRWFHLLLGLLVVVTLAAFADPLETSPGKREGIMTPSPLGDLLAEPSGKKSPEMSPASAIPAAPSTRDRGRMENRGGPRPQLSLPPRLANPDVQVPEASAEEVSRVLAQKLHVNLIFSADPRVRLTAATLPGESTEGALQRIFDAGHYRLVRSGENFEIHERSGNTLRRTTWAELLARAR